MQLEELEEEESLLGFGLFLLRNSIKAFIVTGLGIFAVCALMALLVH